ncbi:MAG: SDR family NAD(P)-dependent oxidoreductase, partial [Proteobacteria bacterium]|nr:SDR family NAD(P)-dependent oxidoreductase [Pseudomonadota bacterium]
MSLHKISGTVLVTGAAGYIGSHTVLALLREGYRVIALDDYSNARRDVPERVAHLCAGDVQWVEADVRDQATVEAVLASQGVEAVIHFAARKSVEESCRLPLAYYDSNLIGTLRLLAAME